MDEITPEQKKQMFAYLATVRKSGQINMFESPRYLMRDFGITRKQAFAIFEEWSKTFKKE